MRSPCPDADPVDAETAGLAARELADALADRCQIDRRRVGAVSRMRGGVMTAAHRPVQRPRDAKLLVINADGQSRTRRDRGSSIFYSPVDLVVANDAATLPRACTACTCRRRRRSKFGLHGRRVACAE